MTEDAEELLATFGKNLSVVESDMWLSKLIFDNRTNNVHALNVTGKIIWDSISDAASLDTLVDKVLYWCNGPTKKDDVVHHVSSFLTSLRDADLLIPISEGGGFPVGLKVTITQTQSNVAYIEPQISTYTKEWLEQKHPAAFHQVLFSDTWGPSTPKI